MAVDGPLFSSALVDLGPAAGALTERWNHYWPGFSAIRFPGQKEFSVGSGVRRVGLKTREADSPYMAHWLSVTTADNWSRCLATKT